MSPRYVIFLIALCLPVVAPTSLSATPLLGPNWIINEPDRVLVDFEHGAVVPPSHSHPPVGLATFMSPPIPPPAGGAPVSFWRVDLNMALADGTALGVPDRVSAIGFVQHVVGPHGEGAGPIFPFSLTINAAGPLGMPVEDSTGPISKDHDSHIDILIRASLSGTNSPMGNFAGVDFNIAAQHVIPEPSTLIPMSIVVICSVLAAATRASSSKDRA